MSVLAWIVRGLIAGFIASNLATSSGQAMLLDLVLGVAGAVFSGFLFAAFAATGFSGFSLYGMFVAITGAIVVLWVHPAPAIV